MRIPSGCRTSGQRPPAGSNSAGDFGVGTAEALTSQPDDGSRAGLTRRQHLFRSRFASARTDSGGIGVRASGGRNRT